MASLLSQVAKQLRKNIAAAKKDDGMIRVSPSQIKTWRQCQRLWAFQKIEKVSTPSSMKQQFGTDTHTHLERWLGKGITPDLTEEGRVAAQGIKPDLLPTPGKHLLIERKFAMSFGELPNDVLIIGLVDCVVPPDLENTTPTVIDHKTTSDLKWALTEEQLAEDPQGLIYSEFGMREFGAPQAVARWVYYAASNPRDGGKRRPKGTKKVEHLFVRDSDEYRAAWAILFDDIRGLVNAKRSWKSANDDAPATPTACNNYGGCAFKKNEMCRLEKGDRTAALLAQDDREHKSSTHKADSAYNEPGGIPKMNLLDTLKANKAKTEAPQPDDEKAEKTNGPTQGSALLARLQQKGKAAGINPPARTQQEHDAAAAPNHTPSETMPPAVVDAAAVVVDAVAVVADAETVSPAVIDGTAAVTTARTGADAEEIAKVAVADYTEAVDALMKSTKTELFDAATVLGLTLPRVTKKEVIARAILKAEAGLEKLRQPTSEASSDGAVAAEAAGEDVGDIEDAEDSDKIKTWKADEFAATQERHKKETGGCGGMVVGGVCENPKCSWTTEGSLIIESVEKNTDIALAGTDDEPAVPVVDGMPIDIIIDKEKLRVADEKRKGGLIILLDCTLRKGPKKETAVREFAEWVKPIADHVAKENGVEYWGLVDFKGAHMLAAKVEKYLETHAHAGYLHVDSQSPEGRACKDVLLRHAAIVIQANR